MKNIFIILLFVFGFFLQGCMDDDDQSQIDNFAFEAIVLGQGIDCGDIYTISLKSLEANSDFEDGTYYALNLESEFKEQGLKILLNCRPPNNDEMIACTTQGPSYPHIVVLNSLIVE